MYFNSSRVTFFGDVSLILCERFDVGTTACLVIAPGISIKRICISYLYVLANIRGALQYAGVIMRFITKASFFLICILYQSQLLENFTFIEH